MRANPPLGGPQERKSLEFYLKRASQTKPQDGVIELWRRIRREYCDTVYRKFVKDFPGLEESGFISDELWAEIEKSINLDAGPGVDYCYEYKTNRDLLDPSGERLRADVQRRIYNRMAFYETAISCDPSSAEALQLVVSGLQDPIRVFGKNEPTSWSKETRVINSVSVADSCCERVLTLRRANAFTVDWMDGPSSVGIQLKDEQAMIEFREQVEKRLGEEVTNDDMQGYEYAFRQECVEVAYDIECYLRSGKFLDETDRFDTWAKLLYVEKWLTLAPSVIVCSDGVVLLTNEVWLRSGRFKTSFHGTHVRSALTSLAASFKEGKFVYVPSVSNGDDNLSKHIGELDYSPLGFVVTDRRVSKGADPWSFCSHLIFRDCHYPESVSKTILNLLRNKKVTPELYDAFRFTNCARPDWPEVDKFVQALVEEAESLLHDGLEEESLALPDASA